MAFAQSGPGRPAADAEIKAKDLTILPNGAGLPKGHGAAKQGEVIFKDKCAVCHNEEGEGRENQYPTKYPMSLTRKTCLRSDCDASGSCCVWRW
jgi:mono/diheme cytochrome c family protein